MPATSIARTRRSNLRFSLRTVILSVLVVAASLQVFLVTKYSRHMVFGNNEHAFQVKEQTVPSSADAHTISGEEPVKVTSLPRATIAYAVSLTSCEAKFTADGAAILKHSIHLSSYPQNKESKYAYKMFAFVHPDALSCSEDFGKLGYEVMVKEVPINASEIEQEFLREHVVKSGCCGDKEFLKLYAYTLVDYPVAVHLDLDSLVLKPFDDLYDAMLDGKTGSVPVMNNKELPKNVEAFFTRDYNMIHPGHKHPGVQGGFLVIKPNMEHFDEYKRVILKGDFIAGGGWAGIYGGYFGAQQIQGLCSYFFDGLHPGTAVELNRCNYNSMNDNPIGEIYRGKDKGSFKCRDGKEKCEDCRKTDIENIYSAHFTLCQKPWVCHGGVVDKRSESGPLCRDFHKKWFNIRKDWDESRQQLDPKLMEGVNYYNEIFQGYCTQFGPHHYKPVAVK